VSAIRQPAAGRVGDTRRIPRVALALSPIPSAAWVEIVGLSVPVIAEVGHERNGAFFA